MRFPLFLAGTLCGLIATARAEAQDGIDFFEQKIRPVLVQKCYRCHSAEAAENKKLRGGLYLDTRAGIRKGGDTGPAVVPGDLDKSLLLEALHYKNDDLQMPPSGQLPEAVIADFVRWVKMGAPDPRDGKTVVKKYEIDIEAGRNFWSVRPLQQHQPPQVKNRAWPTTEVDSFILAKLEQAKLEPVEDAHPRFLVRRLYFDLIGMPPTPKQIESFVAHAEKNRQQAIETLVDQLLASPRFGERWGRHWLDVARFGESNGGTKNNAWPDAWRYREYVIQAFNKDKPYDQFVLEQLAGDLLPADNEEQKQQQKVATAFLAMGSQEANAPRMEVIGEQLDVMGRAFLGISVGCSRCHDHKFDPVPTRDFYAMAGILLNTEIRDDAPLGNYDKKLRKTYKDFHRTVATSTRKISQGIDRLYELCEQAEVRRMPWESWDTVITRLPDGRQGKAKQAYQQVQDGNNELKNLRKKDFPNILQAVAANDRPGKGRNFINAHVHIRGSEKNLGEEIPRGIMQILHTDESLNIGEKESGRLQMAGVIRKHPLVARVMVNRIWHHLFGRGIVRTPDNFGKLGEPPSHPQLLDWLAVKFIEDDWSVKKTIRRIVLTRTYQLSAEAPSDRTTSALTIDPDNTLLWRHTPRRLDAESIRDAILLASDSLDVTPPDRLDLLAFHSQMSDIKAVDRIDKRAVYLPVNRGIYTDLMAVFNFPPATLVVGRRETATVPTQALFLLNSPLVIEHSQRMAHNLLVDKSLSDRERVDRACQLILGRKVNTDEQSEMLAFVEGHQKLNETQSDEIRQVDAWSALCQSLFCSAEFRFVR